MDVCEVVEELEMRLLDVAGERERPSPRSSSRRRRTRKRRRSRAPPLTAGWPVRFSLRALAPPARDSEPKHAGAEERQGRGFGDLWRKSH